MKSCEYCQDNSEPHYCDECKDAHDGHQPGDDENLMPSCRLTWPDVTFMLLRIPLGFFQGAESALSGLMDSLGMHHNWILDQRKKRALNLELSKANHPAGGK